MAAIQIPRLAIFVPLRSSSATRTPLYQGLDGSVIRSLESTSIAVDTILKLNKSPTTDCAKHHGTPLVSGVEASLTELGNDAFERNESVGLLRSAGLNLIVNMNGSSRNTNTASNSVSISDRIKLFESQLQDISDLGEIVAHINCREGSFYSSGSGYHNMGSKVPSEESALDYLLEVLPLSAQFLENHPYIGKAGNETDVMGGSPPHLTGISHETAGGILYHPRITRHLLEVLPPLRLTMNLSSWHDACGYSWGFHDGIEEDEAEALSAEILPHIDLIRTKMDLLSNHVIDNGVAPEAGFQSQGDPHSLLQMHKCLWKGVWARKAARGVEQIFMSLENDYAGFGINMDSHCEDKDSHCRQDQLEVSARCIHEIFKSWSTSALP